MWSRDNSSYSRNYDADIDGIVNYTTGDAHMFLG